MPSIAKSVTVKMETLISIALPEEVIVAAILSSKFEVMH